MSAVRRVKLSDFKAKKEEEGAIDLEMDDGTDEHPASVFRIPPPELWSDEVAQLTSDNDTVGAAKALLGDRYDEYVAAGGTAMVLLSVIGDEHGITVPESSASSPS